MLVLDDYAMYMLWSISRRRDTLKEFAYLRFERLPPADEAGFQVAIEEVGEIARNLVSSQILLANHIVQLAYGYPPYSMNPDEYEGLPNWYLELSSEAVEDLIEEHTEMQAGDEISILKASILYELVKESVLQFKIGYPPSGPIESLYYKALKEMAEN